MNQTYLQGLASDMDGLDSAVFFEATPENIAAFLMRHQTAEKSAVGAADGRVLLTARMGFIDVCPDQEYLTQKLLPLYFKIQGGDLPAPPLNVVPKDMALADGCPRPDWNYLRFDGYSDKKYLALASGEAILPLQWYGETMSMELQVRSYPESRTPAWAGPQGETVFTMTWNTRNIILMTQSCGSWMAVVTGRIPRYSAWRTMRGTRGKRAVRSGDRFCAPGRLHDSSKQCPRQDF